MKIQSKTFRINGTDLIETMQNLLDRSVVNQGLVSMAEPSKQNKLELIRLTTLRDKFRCEPIVVRRVTVHGVE